MYVRLMSKFPYKVGEACIYRSVIHDSAKLLKGDALLKHNLGRPELLIVLIWILLPILWFSICLIARTQVWMIYWKYQHDGRVLCKATLRILNLPPKLRCTP